MSHETEGFTPDDQLLGWEEAHDEANKMRSLMEMDPKTGKVEKMAKPDSERQYLEPVRWVEKDPTHEDYEAASKALDELEKLAEAEPKVFTKLLQLGEISLFGLLAPITIASEYYTQKINEAIGDKKKAQTDPVELFKSLKNRVFSDARSRLKRLEA
jgi:hypothetical protein